MAAHFCTFGSNRKGSKASPEFAFLGKVFRPSSNTLLDAIGGPWVSIWVPNCVPGVAMANHFCDELGMLSAVFVLVCVFVRLFGLLFFLCGCRLCFSFVFINYSSADPGELIQVRLIQDLVFCVA